MLNSRVCGLFFLLGQQFSYYMSHIYNYNSLNIKNTIVSVCLSVKLTTKPIFDNIFGRAIARILTVFIAYIAIHPLKDGCFLVL